jgi:hypothetical protein
MHIEETLDMMRLILRATFIFVVVFSCTSFLCFGQNTKQSRPLDYFSKKADIIEYAIFKGQPTPSKDLLTLLKRQANWDEAEPGTTNPMGLRLRFVKIDEPAKAGAPAETRYRVFADGAPENKVFSIGSWKVSKEFLLDSNNIYADAGVAGSHDIYVNAQGLLMLHRPKPDERRVIKTADELDVTPVTGNGEPMRYLLDSLDEELQIVGTLVPHPITSEDQGCKIEARIAQPDTTAVLIIVDGFEPRSKVPVVLESEHEVVHDTLIADANGHAVIAGFPYIPGKTQGTLKATAEGLTCLPSVEIPWGAASQPAPAPAKAP